MSAMLRRDRIGQSPAELALQVAVYPSEPMRQIVRKRGFALVIAGLLAVAGIGIAAHDTGHAGQSADGLCSFCISASHGKGPPPAFAMAASGAPGPAGPVTASDVPISLRGAQAPPARAPPLATDA